MIIENLKEWYLIYIISFIFNISIITMLAACLCCRKKVPKNELLGLEGLVKIKNPDENLQNGNTILSIDSKSSLNVSSSVHIDGESKRASNAPHRSLPDIPISEVVVDTSSELYATVGDKINEKTQENIATNNMKKQLSLSQHSSLSQADEIYAHAYDKVRPTEHPYAQLNVTNNSNNNNTNNNTTQPQPQSGSNQLSTDQVDNVVSRRGSNQSLLGDDNHQVIQAASAISGRISASQEIPYMTPPIVVQSQQNFSGDSQDSSKGYTSISVREPLANIIAQTNQKNAQLKRQQNLVDSHYATVSDDSDEMYAAIEDPNQQTDLYTSGSETYAQILPPTTLSVLVEINTPDNVRQHTNNVQQSRNSSPPVLPSTSTSTLQQQHQQQQQQQQRQSITNTNPQQQQQQQHVIQHQNSNQHHHQNHPESTSEILRNIHSRQESSSSCTSSAGNLSSPKPEKRQANSPLPPTPKNSNNSSILTTNSVSSSGRNSVASVIDGNLPIINMGNKQLSRENLNNDQSYSGPVERNIPVIEINNRKQDKLKDDEKIMKKKSNPSKDLEGMYAKVMKKNKLSNAPMENSSPEPIRKSMNDIILNKTNITSDIHNIVSTNNNTNIHQHQHHLHRSDNNYETIDNERVRKISSDSKDPGYETIPADKIANTENNNINLGKAIQKSGDIKPMSTRLMLSLVSDKNNNDPGYETINQCNDDATTNSVNIGLITTHTINTNKKLSSDYDPNYEVLRTTDEDLRYGHVWDKSKLFVSNNDELSDGYSSIKSTNKSNNIVDYYSIKGDNDDDLDDDKNDDPDYSRINENFKLNIDHDYASILEARKSSNKRNVNSNIGDDNEDDDDDEDNTSDIYTSILQNEEKIPISNNHNYSTISEIMKESSDLLSFTSSDQPLPNNLISDTNNTRIILLKNNNNNNYYSFNNQFINQNISNYESLTGSESDPNYECLKYTKKENPYERLLNKNLSNNTISNNNNNNNVINNPNILKEQYGQSQIINNLDDNSLTPESLQSLSVIAPITPTTVSTISTGTNAKLNVSKDMTNTKNNNNVHVDDYFQV